MLNASLNKTFLFIPDRMHSRRAVTMCLTKVMIVIIVNTFQCSYSQYLAMYVFLNIIQSIAKYNMFCYVKEIFIMEPR